MKMLGVSKYKDRHGVERWRYRHGKTSISLPGAPGDDLFQQRYLLALEGRKSFAEDRQGLDLRRIAMLEHYAKPALKRASTRAKAAGVRFDLTRDDFEAIMRRQDWKCAVSGIVFDLYRLDHDKERRAFRPSIDRVEPAKGYVIDNVRLVCEIANLAMNEWGEKPLIEFAKHLVANLSG